MASETQNQVIAAFTDAQAERLTGVSQRQLGYWARNGFYRPSLSINDPGLLAMRLYSFRDLVCLKVLNELRNEAKISFPELKATKERLSYLGDDLWAKTTLFVHGKRVVFENPSTGEKEEASTGQGVLQIPLRIVTGQMEDKVRAMRGRNPSDVGQIEKKRGVAQSQPVISGTRIPVRSIQAFFQAGYSPSEIHRQYPTLTIDDISAALSYKEVA